MTSERTSRKQANIQTYGVLLIRRMCTHARRRVTSFGPGGGKKIRLLDGLIEDQTTILRLVVAHELRGVDPDRKVGGGATR